MHNRARWSDCDLLLSALRTHGHSREAFEQALEGAYFAHDLFAAHKQGRIGGFPFDPRAPVQTFWDLGRNDLNTIWLHQHLAASTASSATTRTAASSSGTTWPG